MSFDRLWCSEVLGSTIGAGSGLGVVSLTLYVLEVGFQRMRSGRPLHTVL